MKHIVLMGGGSGVSQLLQYFCKEEWSISAIIATGDSGGSSGVIRSEYGIPAIGDIVNNLTALGGDDTAWMRKRYTDGFLAGHTAGNLWLLGLIKTYGFAQGIKKAHTMLGYTRHTIIPATDIPHDIVVTTLDGQTILGECDIISAQNLTHTISSVALTPTVPASREAQEAIQSADIIILGPGTLYTSLLACLLPEGMEETLARSTAKKVFVANVANFPPGHCDGYALDDYLSELARLSPFKHFDAILAHDGTGVPSEESVKTTPLSALTLMDVMTGPAKNLGGKFDSIKRNTFRHDGEKVLQWIKKIYS